MRVITGLFDSRELANDAIDALEDAGIPSDAITIVGPHANDASSGCQKIVGSSHFFARALYGKTSSYVDCGS